MNKNVEHIINTVNEKVLKDMEQHGLQWVKAWTSKEHRSLEGHYYSGFNRLWLHCQPFEHKIYGTYIQWNKKGFKVKKGSKAVPLLLYKPFSKEITNEDGATETKYFNLLRTFSVFNIDQVEGDKSKLLAVPKNEVVDIKHVEDFVKNTKAIIEHEGSRACYIPSADKIKMPSKEDFFSTGTKNATEHYYSTLMHELTHWTGAEHRLKRGQGGFFGSPEYAFEELIAELGSAYACAQLNIEPSPREDHASYLQSWMRAIKENKNALMKASGLAGKALTYLNELQPKTEGLKAVA